MTQQSTLFHDALERSESAFSAAATQNTPTAQSPVLRQRSASGRHPGASWRAWTADTDEQHAAAAFYKRYGVWPEYIVDGLGGLLLVGPVPEGEV